MPRRVTEEFLAGVQTISNTPPVQYPGDSEGWTYIIDVDDPQPNDPLYGYMFELRLRRNDMDYWVADIECTAVTGNNEIAWSSKIIKD